MIGDEERGSSWKFLVLSHVSDTSSLALLKCLHNKLNACTRNGSVASTSGTLWKWYTSGLLGKLWRWSFSGRASRLRRRASSLITRCKWIQSKSLTISHNQGVVWMILALLVCIILLDKMSTNSGDNRRLGICCSLITWSSTYADVVKHREIGGARIMKRDYKYIISL